MEEFEKITIVMPVYCPGKYLRPCIESLLAQTFQDFRLIAIDDASQDGSYEILQEYAKGDSRILVLRNPYRLGAARTRNIGIQMACGTYLLCLDSDDYFEPNFLEELYDRIDTTRSDVVICEFYFRDEFLKKEFVVSAHPFLKNKLKNGISPWDICEDFFQIFSANPFTKMWRLSFVLAQGLQYQYLPNSNDVSFVEIGILAAKSIAYISQPLVHYRYNISGQISATRGKNPLCFYEAAMKIYHYMNMRDMLQYFRRSFYTWMVVDMVVAILKAEGEEKKQAINFMRHEGFNNLSMTNLCEKDFRNIESYMIWRNFYKQGIVESHSGNIVYQCFFEKLKERDGIYALWGYGKLGKEFMQEARRYKFPIREVYDQNESKWNDGQIPPVKDFSLRDLIVDTVIYTNPRFSSEIKNIVQLENANVKLIDFSLFRQFNVIGEV